MKTILVIDVPDDVAEAYGDITVDYDLRGRPKEDGFCYTESIRYVEDCPLKPMPEKKWVAEGFDRIMENNKEHLMSLGWNACIDEILGEEK